MKKYKKSCFLVLKCKPRQEVFTLLLINMYQAISNFLDIAVDVAGSLMFQFAAVKGETNLLTTSHLHDINLDSHDMIEPC
jgi:hypothetical protein